MASTHIDLWVSVELICKLGTGATAETVFNYRSSTTSISEGDLLVFAQLWRDTMKPIIQAAMSNSVTLYLVRAKTHFASFPNVEADAPFPVATVGGIASAETPANVALAVKLLTGIIGRSNRGRQYWLGIPSNSFILDTAASGFISLLSAVFTKHLLGWSASGVTYIPAVPSRKLGTIRPVVEFAIESILDSQRRRLLGRGT
jgi:hypothetical protein